MENISQIIAHHAINQLIDGFQCTGYSLERLFKKLLQDDKAVSGRDSTPSDYAVVAEGFVDMMNKTLVADMSAANAVHYNNVFTGCTIKKYNARSEDDFLFEFTMRFADLKYFNTVVLTLEEVWSPEKFLSELKYPEISEATHDVTLENFWDATAGEWQLHNFKDFVPTSKVVVVDKDGGHALVTYVTAPENAVIINRSASGSVQFTMPDEPGTIYRISDHWGSGVAECNWYLKGFEKCNSFVFRDKHKGEVFCGKIKMEKLYKI